MAGLAMSIDELRAAEVLGARAAALRELLRLSEQVLDKAQAGSWIEAVNLQKVRRDAMDSFFAQACSSDESSLIADVIETMLSLDDRVTELVYQQRRSVMAFGAKQRRQVNNVNQYLNCGA